MLVRTLPILRTMYLEDSIPSLLTNFMCVERSRAMVLFCLFNLFFISCCSHTLYLKLITKVGTNGLSGRRGELRLRQKWLIRCFDVEPSIETTQWLLVILEE